MKTLSVNGIEKEPPQGLRAAPGVPRLSGLQGKLIIPYAMLTLVLASVGIFVITRLVTSTIHERFVNQLYEAARVASDAVVRQERTNLENLRLVTYTKGVDEAITAGDSNALEELLLPLSLNNQIDVLSVVNKEGIEILTLGRVPESGQYLRTQGADFSSYDLVNKTLAGVSDEQGDKYVGLLETSYGPTFFTGAPVYDLGEKVIGGVLVGAHLSRMLADIKAQTALADIIIFNANRQLITTTLAEPDEGFQILEAEAQSIEDEEMAQVHDLRLYNRDFQITYADLAARQQRLGWLGVVLPSSYVVAAGATSRNLLSLLFTLGTLAIIVIGYVLSRSIARPILKLRSLTQSVAAGDLDQRIGLDRSDEIGELADAFDQMTLRLRERTSEAARLYAEAIQHNIELADTNERLRTTQLQLVQSEKLAAIGKLTAGIVHDVKNPLTVIKGIAELVLSEDTFPPGYQKELTLIHESAHKANNIVTDLLKFARQSEPQMQDYDMRETVETALRLTAYPIRKAHVQVVSDLPKQAVVMAYDRQQIEQVLVNLINNAVQAMPDGGTMRVTLTQAEGIAAIAVQDTGIGIPPENLGHIFDPFFTTKPEGEGTGLGLSVSYGIISNHSGQFEVESVVGQGTTFTILMPIKQPETMGTVP